MFEQNLEQMVATVFIDAKDSRLADQYGITLPAGNNTLTSAAALELVRKFDRALSGGIVYARNQKRVRSTRNQIVFAFGPDMEAAL